MYKEKNSTKLCKEEHLFYIQKKEAEAKVLMVLIITIFTMILEILTGYLFNSVALLADGIHMGSHAFAFVVAYLSYYMARKLSTDPSFAFGTWKIEVLGAYTNGLILLFLSLIVLWEGIVKFFKPGETRYEEAIIVALLGLIVNLVCAYILYHKDEESSSQHTHHHDLNLKGALYHVATDALTSVFALMALFTGKYLNLWFMDPIMGIAGSLVIANWSLSLIKETLPILLDREVKNSLYGDLIKAIERDGKSKVKDIHLLRIYPNKYACILGIITTEDVEVEYYEKILSEFDQIVHATIELRKCPK